MNITDKQEKYVASQIKIGDFQNAKKLVHYSLRLHEIYRYRAVEELCAEIEKGWDGEISKRSATDIAKAKAQKT